MLCKEGLSYVFRGVLAGLSRGKKRQKYASQNNKADEKCEHPMPSADCPIKNEFLGWREQKKLAVLDATIDKRLRSSTVNINSESKHEKTQLYLLRVAAYCGYR